ncbi:hypothetical protein FNV43_RR16209 [Rhamnella rubrinervis]|uniref:Pentatricopeptide repeat-containing protein n=1 Tax=Rhamnella rubrinervis TaxID=2594499 RepID=A0A8K0E9B6_9ROSA|nr:hypothetical protein FNV43_RR16209 [Rhamnella rubrinervis]
MISRILQNSIFQYLLPRCFAIKTSSFSTTPSSLPNHHSLIPARLHHKDWLAPNEVLEVFTSIKDPNSVITALHHYSKRKDYKPNEALYTLVINKLAQARLLDAIEEVMHRIKVERNCRLSDEFFRNVIKVYGNVGGRINKAMETLFDMPEFNCWPSVKTFNFVLNLLVCSRLFDVVHELYVAAPKLGIEIDACCLNILIKGLCECGKLDAALNVLDEFPRQSCTPTAMTFSTLMHGLCEKGKVEEAFGLFERMEKEGIDPDTITFNILIAGLRKRGKVEDAMVLLERMKLRGCKPNAGSYQEVLYGLLDLERFVEAKEFMSQIISKGVNPSFVSYKLLIHGLCKENLLEDVEWALKQMARQGFVPKMGMWREILRSIFNGKNNHSYISSKEIVENLTI